MAFDIVTEFFDELPSPCLYLSHDGIVVYANHAARRLVQHQGDRLQGNSIYKTTFFSDQGITTITFDRAVQTFEQEHPQRGIELASSSDTSQNWDWRLSKINIRDKRYYCLLAHASNNRAKQDARDRFQRLQHITKPSFDTADHFVTISTSDMRNRAVNDYGRAESDVFAEHLETMDVESKEWRLFNEDFTTPLAMTDTAIANAFRAGKGVLSIMRGTEHPVTGARSILDGNVVLINDPDKDELLGCIVQVRPAQEWSEFLVRHDLASKTTTAASNDTVKSTMVRTMLLNGDPDFFSPSWEQFSGYTRSSLCQGSWSESVHPADLPQLTNFMTAAMTTGERQEYEIRYLEKASGKYRYFSECIAPWKDTEGRVTRWYCIANDIHELVSQRRAAKLATERLYNIVQNMDITIFEIDTAYNIRSAEGAMPVTLDEGTQQQASQFAGMSLKDAVQAVSSEGVQALTDGVEQVMTGEKTKAVVEYELSSQRLRTILVPIRDDAATADPNSTVVRGVLGLTLDYTAQYNNEQSAIEIEAMKQSGRLKDEFLANISHELRTPIAGLLGLVHLLQETDLTVDQMDMIGGLQTSATSLSRIVNDLLDYSKADAHAMPIEQAPFKLNDVLIDLTKSNEILALRKGLQLEIGLITAPALLGDALRVRQILHNLLSNAIKFTETGFVELRTTSQLQPDGRLAVQMMIKDSGIGIDEETLKRLFQPFVQADQSTTRLYGGTGLGLSIARKLAHAMGGEVTLSSVRDQGTISLVTLTFELAPISNTVLTSDVQINEQLTIAPFMKAGVDILEANILVVEDNMINQKVITGILRNLGVGNVSWAAHGGEALTHMTAALKDVATGAGDERRGASQFQIPDLIFMDCQMPVVDGFDCTRHIRSQLQYHGPIIALTASAIQGYKAKCLQAGMNDYITKPFTKKDISMVLQKWLPKT